MKKYKLHDPDNKGLLRISLVDDPAIQSTLMAFSAEKEPVLFANDEQRIIYAPALIPNKLIFRNNIKGEPAEVYFDADTIKQLHIDGMRNGYDSRINLQHEKENTDGIFCFESWIIEDNPQDKAYKMGFDVPVGTLMKAYKIDNEEVWADIKAGKITGLSIEAMLDSIEEKKEPVKLNKMKNKQSFWEKAVALFKSEHFKFEDMTNYGGGFFGSSLEVGAIVTDKEGNPMVNTSFEYEGNKYTTGEMGEITNIEPIEKTTDPNADRIAELEAENADLKDRLAQYEQTNMSAEKGLKDKDAQILKLQNELVEAKKIQAVPPMVELSAEQKKMEEFKRKHKTS